VHRLVAAGVVAVFFLIVLRGKGFAQNSATPITDCEDITQPGNYVLTNDLVLYAGDGYGFGGDCLVISSSQVNIDLGGWAITAACPPYPYCPGAEAPVGGTAIHVMKGGDHVSIANGGAGSDEGFYYGIVGEPDHISASNITVIATMGHKSNRC